MVSMACSTLPVNTRGRRTALPALAAATAALAAAEQPSPFRALISTALQPMAAPSLSRSIRSPFLRTRSIMFTAITTGMPSSISWVVR